MSDTLEDEAREWPEAWSPPPWSAVPTGETTEDGTPIFHVVCDGYEDEAPLVCGSAGEAWPLFEADAKLLAAAPEMLGAVKAMLAVNDGIVDAMAATDDPREASRIATAGGPQFSAALEPLRAIVALATGAE